jgi:hypothetical protein
MDTTKFSDPASVGPGCWFKIHVDAISATDDKSKFSFINSIINLSKNFKCNDCKVHFTKYISDNPPSNYFNTDDGMFKWSWEFHNGVNKRLKKKIIKYEEAFKYFSDEQEGVCFDCSPEDEPIKVSRTIPDVLSKYVNLHIK